MNWYATIKLVHIACVTLSIAGFVARFVLMQKKSALVTRRWVRIVPHINDTLLLAAAIALMAMSGQYPFVDAWLSAKVFGLIAYIVLGTIALKVGRTDGARLAAGMAALLVFGYVVSVALNKDARGALASGEGPSRAALVHYPEPRSGELPSPIRPPGRGMGGGGDRLAA